MQERNFKERLAEVEAFVFDVDGVMTDGKIIPTPDGDFIRCYYAKDGYAMAYAIRQGHRICIISGGFGATLRSRMERLGVRHYYLGCMDKIAAIREFAEKEGVNLENTIYMGDDIPDVECMRLVGLPVCPADACREVIDESVYVSEFDGGHGAVRDVIEQVLRAKGDWAIDSKGVIAEDSDKVASR